MSRPLVNLTFHGIGTPRRALAGGERATWIDIRGFLHLMDRVAGRPDVRVTFDDGNASDVDVALPALLDRGLVGEFFVCAGLLGGPGRISASGLRELVAAGMPVGSHGWGHRDWRRVRDRTAVQEFLDAPKAIEDVTGMPVRHAAVPFGSYDRTVLAAMRRAGMTCVYTSDRGRVRPNAWLQPRNSVPHDAGDEWAHRVLDRAPSPRHWPRRTAVRLVKRYRGRPADDTDPSTPTVPAGRTGPARIGVVVVTYNSADVLADCLESLPRCVQHDDRVELAGVVVADNASRDKSVTIARDAEAVPVRVVELGGNLGYAAGVNAGIAALDLDSLDAVLVANPDCRFTPGSLGVMADRLLGTDSCGCVAPRLLQPGGMLQPSLRRTPSIPRAIAESLLGKLAGRTGLGELVTDPQQYRNAAPWAWATGAVLLLSASMVAELGPWDESYLLYSEETEYLLRAGDRGWRVWYEPGATVEHVGGLSHLQPRFAALIVSNRVKLYRARHGRPAGVVFEGAVLLGEALRTLVGRRTSRAAFVALVRPSRRMLELPA